MLNNSLGLSCLLDGSLKVVEPPLLQSGSYCSSGDEPACAEKTCKVLPESMISFRSLTFSQELFSFDFSRLSSIGPVKDAALYRHDRIVCLARLQFGPPKLLSG